MGVIRRIIGLALGGLFLLSATALRAEAQNLPVEPAAESVFLSAASAFEAGRYPSAAEAFLSVADDYPTHRRTTAASVMAGKALYRAGLYDTAAERLSNFERTWPRSSYVREARATRMLAEEASRKVREKPLNLGVLLSLTGDEARLSQALFNGLLIAVEEYNAANPTRPARLVFSEIGPSPESAGAAIATLGRQDVSVALGGLFSDQAQAAAAAAERFEMVYVAPLATDGAVSKDRRFSFQSNPTLAARGQAMARFAMNGLLLRDLAVISAQGDGGVGTTMASAFAQEVRQLGGSISLIRTLPSSREWFRLPSYLATDSLDGIRAVYLPISGSGSDRVAAAALAGLDEVGANVRVLGNSEWHELPIRSLASRYSATYSNDYLVDLEQPATALFFQAYETRFGASPGRVSVVGYDVGRLVLTALDAPDSRAAAERLRNAPPFEGLGMQIDFAGGQVNHALFFHRYRQGAPERIR